MVRDSFDSFLTYFVVYTFIVLYKRFFKLYIDYRVLFRKFIIINQSVIRQQNLDIVRNNLVAILVMIRIFLFW